MRKPVLTTLPTQLTHISPFMRLSDKDCISGNNILQGIGVLYSVSPMLDAMGQCQHKTIFGLGTKLHKSTRKCMFEVGWVGGVNHSPAAAQNFGIVIWIEKEIANNNFRDDL